MIADLYARKSTADAGTSARRQEEDWREDCAREGIEPGRVFADPELSASIYRKQQDRPDYNQLIKHIESGNCQMLSMWEVSRGSRDSEEWMRLLKICRRTGTLIRVFQRGNDRTFDIRKRRDWRQIADEALDAEEESLQLSDRTLDGTRDAARNGKPPGPLLYGYRREYERAGERNNKGKSLITVMQLIDPEQSVVVRQLVANTLKGIPLNEQARRLNEAGVATPSGQGQWRGFQIRRLLINPGLAGHRVYHGKITKHNAWPGVVTEDEHRQLLAALEVPRRGRRRNHGGTALTHQLSGAGLCGVCGHALRTERATRYVCKWRGCGKVSARISDMDEAVDRMILPWLRRDDAAGAFTPDDDDDDEVREVRRDLQERRDHLEKFYDDAAENKLSAETVARMEALLKRKIDELEARVRKLSTPTALRALAGVDVPGEWSTLPVGLRREVILRVADVRLSPVGRGTRGWSDSRLAESRFRGDPMTWGERWRG